MSQTVNALIQLGQIFLNFTHKKRDKYYKILTQATKQASIENTWFTIENINYCINHWGDCLSQENLTKWLSPYTIENISPKKVGIIMAGNIPLVGFHDLLCTLVCGHRAHIKLSSQDKILLPTIANILIDINPSLKNLIYFEDGHKSMDMMIATGSNNTAKYFEYYFKNIPSIIRKNRTSVTVISKSNTNKQLEALADDIFYYFGLGCRSISKIFIPQGFDLNKIFKGVFHKKNVISHTKYFNNYQYNKTIYLMNNHKLLENGFCILKEDEGYHSPIAVLFYEYYHSIYELDEKLKKDSEKLQCIVGNTGIIKNEIPFGYSQKPKLWNYADNIDVIHFLNNA